MATTPDAELLREINRTLEYLHNSDATMRELVESIERKLGRIEGKVGIQHRPALRVVREVDEETPC